MSYSTDLRKRCVEYYASGNTKEKTAKVLKVSTSTVSRWRAELRDNGVWKNTYKTDSRVPNKLKYEALKTYVDNHPNAFLYEIASVFNASSEGMRNALECYKITRKKDLFL
jgi:transposase